MNNNNQNNNNHIYSQTNQLWSLFGQLSRSTTLNTTYRNYMTMVNEQRETERLLRETLNTPSSYKFVMDPSSTNLILKIPYTRTTMPIPIKNEDTEKIVCPNKDVFIPGNDSGTYYTGYASSIDVDSILKNIDKNLETDANIFNSYVPDSNSDLYLENYNTDVEKEELHTTEGKKVNISNKRFYNHTRQQLKDT